VLMNVATRVRENCYAFVIHEFLFLLRLGLRLMLFEPAGHVKHFSDVVTGRRPMPWVLRDADEDGVTLSSLSAV